MGDIDDIAPPQAKSSKNDKESQRLESQYDIIVPELYPLIAQQHQMKLEEEEDPYERVGRKKKQRFNLFFIILINRKKPKVFVQKQSHVFKHFERNLFISKND